MFFSQVLLKKTYSLKLRSLLVSLRVACSGINIYVVSGVLNGLIDWEDLASIWILM